MARRQIFQKQEHIRSALRSFLAPGGKTMKRITLILVSFLLITGCVTQGEFSASREVDASRATLKECDDNGATLARLTYGFTGNSIRSDSRIRLRGRVHVEPGEVYAIELRPRGNSNISSIDLQAADVTVTGKDAASAWLTAGPASYNDTAPDYELIICVPPDQPPGKYHYNVEIKDFGKLDPRADVC